MSENAPNQLPNHKHQMHNRIMAVSAVALLLCATAVSYVLKESPESPVVTDMKAYESSAMPHYSYKNSTGSYLSGKLSASQGDVKGALKYIGETMAYQQGDPQLLRQAYRLSVLAGEFDQAGTYSEKLPVTEEDRLLDPRMLRAMLAIKKNDFNKASELLKVVSPEGANSLFLPILQGWVDFGQSQPINTAKLYDSLKIAGQFKPLLQYQIALLLDAAGKKDEAKEQYDAVFKQKHLSYRIAEVLVNFYQRQSDAEKLKNVHARYEEQYHHALGEIQKSPIVSSPREGAAEIFYGISSLMFSLEAYSEAQIPLQMALDLRPEFDAVYFLQANLLERQERLNEAVLAYQNLKDHPAFGLQARIRMAFCYQDAGRVKEALQSLEETIQKFPNEEEPLLTKADILRVEKKYEQAIAIYTQALEKLKADPVKQWPLFYARGICYERVNQWKKAETDFLEALRLEPDQPDVLNYLGYSWLVQGQHIVQAKEMIEKAMVARPQDAHIIDSMGWALYHLGEYEEALDYMEQAIDLSPRDPTVNEHLGDIYWRLGDKLQAKYQWERALLFEPEEAGQEAAIKKKIAKGLPVEPPKNPKMMSQNLPETSKAEAAITGKSLVETK
jgi:tetratricopeptide (TPR) repeat protein